MGDLQQKVQPRHITKIYQKTSKTKVYPQYFPELNGPQMQHLRLRSWDICETGNALKSPLLRVYNHVEKNKNALLVAPDLRAPWLL